MSQFLVVRKKTVVDQAFVAAVPEVPEVLAPDGVTVVQEFVPGVAEVPLLTHLEVEGAYLEDSAAQVALNLENNATPDADYYQLQFNGAQLQATLHPVSLKVGPRAPAPAREVVEIVAGGQDAGSAIVEV